MRPVLVTDLLCAGRAVLAVDPQARARLATRLLREADAADRFLRRHGTRHPRYGDGTLAAAARHSGLVPDPAICDPEFARALMLVLHALIHRAQSD
jgi:hypothetical protein